MLATAPPAGASDRPRLARRAFRRHALAVHGTATPYAAAPRPHPVARAAIRSRYHPKLAFGSRCCVS